MNRYNLYRLSALLYPGNSDSLNRESTIKKVIESHFVFSNNIPVCLELLPSEIENAFGLLFSCDEVYHIISTDSTFITTVIEDKQNSDGNADVLINISEARYCYLKDVQESKNIYRHISDYYNATSSINETCTLESFKTTIESFLYKVFIQNITKSKALFNNEMNISYIVELLDFSDKEKEVINSFLDYKDDDKDKAIFNIGSLAIEFVTLNGHVDLEGQLNNLTKKTLYLDTNILFRTLGINGERRASSTYSFLKKCSECGQSVKIAKNTEDELFETITFGIERIEKIPNGLKYYAPLDDSMIKHYFETKANSKALSPKIYQELLIQKYERLKTDLSIPVDTFNFYKNAKGHERAEVDSCMRAISEFKLKPESQGLHDAVNLCYIKQLRKGHEKNFNDTMYFFVTADKKLTEWSDSNLEGYPITVFPSDWLSILLKYVSRSGDDYRSFVNFIKNIVSKEFVDQSIIVDVLEGIAEVAEKLEHQEILYQNIIARDYDKITNCKSHQDRVEFAKQRSIEYLEADIEELKFKDAIKENALQNLEEQSKVNSEEIESMKRLAKAREADLVQKDTFIIDSIKHDRRRVIILCLGLLFISVILIYVLLFTGVKSYILAKYYNISSGFLEAVAIGTFFAIVPASLICIYQNFFGKDTLEKRIANQGINPSGLSK